MAQIDVLRPVSTQSAGTVATAQPAGTLHGVTSDNTDTTYISWTTPAASVYTANTNSWSLRVGSHTPPTNYQRHAIRGRVRIRRVNASPAILEDIDVGRDTSPFIEYGNVSTTTTFADQTTSWFFNTDFGLATPGALNNLNIGGGWGSGANFVNTLQTSECYIDIDCRSRPTYDPDIRDAAGVSQASGTVSNTNTPTIHFTNVSLDGLPARRWSIVVTDTVTNTVAYSTSGVGVPPESMFSPELANSSYSAEFLVASTIRVDDEFAHVQTITFTVSFLVNAPPPTLTVSQNPDGILLEWDGESGVFDDDNAVLEIFREDCFGSEQRIAVLPNALNGTYLDKTAPTQDTYPDPETCAYDECEITYRVRYWGLVSEERQPPDAVPAGFIVGWPDTIGSIPGGWTRVTALDGRYPQGSVTAVSGTTGGAASHTHTTPGHTHGLSTHSHGGGGNTGTANTVNRRTHPSVIITNAVAANHQHARPSTNNFSGGTSGSTAPGTSSTANLPATLRVIWIASDGSPTSIPIGALAYGLSNITGWLQSAPATNRFLQGALPSSNGGEQVGGATHTHTVNTHTHTGITHTHTSASTSVVGTGDRPTSVSGTNMFNTINRHSHGITIGNANSGTLQSATASTTGAATSEPPFRRLRTLVNTSGAISVGIIGLWRGDAGIITTGLSRCDGTNGTPDMRDRFARDFTGGSVNGTGGTMTHMHTTAVHGHATPGHTHSSSINAHPQTSTRVASGAPSQTYNPFPHVHSASNTASSAPNSTSSSSGNTNTVSHIPQFETVHFARIESASLEPVEIPQVISSTYAVATIGAIVSNPGMDRLVGGINDDLVYACTTRGSQYERLITSAVPLVGGLPVVSTTGPNENQALIIGVRDNAELQALEQVLSQEVVHFTPYGGTPGWYAPQSWSVDTRTSVTKSLTVTLASREAPTLPNPQDLL